MMIQWTREIDTKNKARIYETVDNLFFIEPNYSGFFSDIYVVGDYAIKRTYYNHTGDVLDHPHASVDRGGDPIECVLQSDKYLLSQMDGHKHLPTIYGYTGSLDANRDDVREDLVVMDFLTGPSLEEVLKSCKTKYAKKRILSEFEQAIKNTLVDILQMGWLPVDFRLRCVYPYTQRGLKIIDYNMYQRIEYMEMNGSVIDFSNPAEVAAEFWNMAIKESFLPSPCIKKPFEKKKTGLAYA